MVQQASSSFNTVIVGTCPQTNLTITVVSVIHVMAVTGTWNIMLKILWASQLQVIWSLGAMLCCIKCDAKFFFDIKEFLCRGYYYTPKQMAYGCVYVYSSHTTWLSVWYLLESISCVYVYSSHTTSVWYLLNMTREYKFQKQENNKAEHICFMGKTALCMV